MLCLAAWLVRFGRPLWWTLLLSRTCAQKLFAGLRLIGRVPAEVHPWLNVGICLVFEGWALLLCCFFKLSLPGALLLLLGLAQILLMMIATGIQVTLGPRRGRRHCASKSLQPGNARSWRRLWVDEVLR